MSLESVKLSTGLWPGESSSLHTFGQSRGYKGTEVKFSVIEVCMGVYIRALNQLAEKLIVILSGLPVTQQMRRKMHWQEVDLNTL